MSGRRAGARAVIPLFPLGTVLVPGLLLPLHIFEPRYRQLMHDLKECPADSRAFGVVAIREGHEVGDTGVLALHEVGTLAVLREVVPYPDGRFDIRANGDARFRIHALLTEGAPYLRAEIEWLPEDPEPADPALPVLAGGVSERFDAYRAAIAAAGGAEAALMTSLPGDPRVLSYLVAAAMVLDLLDRQRLLETTTTAERLRIELRLLARETVLLDQIPSLPAVELARTPSSLN